MLGCLALLLCGTTAIVQEAGAQAPQTEEVETAKDDMDGTRKAPAGEITSETESTAADGTDENASSQTSGTADSGEQDVHTLDVVEVEEERKESGTATIGGSDLQSLPSKSGSITEALKGMSNVQFSNDENSSLTGGEISPPRISISGAKPYENSFLIDGTSISNTLNPTGLGDEDDSTSYNDLFVGGGDQTIFYDTSLIDSISVYTNNVPAKYGNFVGGVVASELRDPRTDKWHSSATGRYTRSQWFNMRNVDSESETPDDQPEFSIYSLSAVTDGPLSDNAALLFAVARKHSTIPLDREENDGSFIEDDQTRVNDNYFTKLLLTPDSDLKLSFDATYAPYTEKRWREAWPDSDWQIENKAYRFGSTVEYMTRLGIWTSKTVYSQNGYNRDTDSSYRYSNSSADEQYGGVGDAQWENRSLDLSLDWDSKDFSAGALNWNLSSGLAYDTTTVDAWNEAAQVDVDVVTSTKRTVTQAIYEEYSQQKSLQTLGYYAQAKVNWERLTLTPGFRMDYDDFSENVDVAPRFKAEYDTLGNGALRLVGGANRYYGSKLRAYALDRYRPYVRYQKQDTNLDGVWDVETGPTVGSDNSYTAAGLDTPYSDELTGGALGSVLGFEYGLEYVHRDHRRQVISRTDDLETYYLTNDGKSIYDGVTLTLSRPVMTQSFGSHVFSLGATKSRTKTFNGSFEDSEDLTSITSGGYPYGYDKVFYNGEYISRSDLPADDFNAPIVLTLSWQAAFLQDRLRLNSVTRWRDSAEGLVNDKRYSKDTPYGTASGSNTSTSYYWLDADGAEYHDAYTEGIISGGFNTDVSVEFDALKAESFRLTLLLDVFNLFNDTVETSVVEGEVAQGRGFYTGLRCEF